MNGQRKDNAHQKENCIMSMNGNRNNRFSVLIKPREWAFDADGTMPLLAAADLAGIRLPNSCRNGTCRTCMCRMISGRIRYVIEWPGLSIDEKKEGYILPCVAYPESDIVIDVPGAANLKGQASGADS